MQRTSLGLTGAIAQRVAAAGILWHPLGTPTDGATRLQSVVALVRGLSSDDRFWNLTSFTKIREGL